MLPEETINNLGYEKFVQNNQLMKELEKLKVQCVYMKKELQDHSPAEESYALKTSKTLGKMAQDGFTERPLYLLFMSHKLDIGHIVYGIL